jgi:hypothetical protein
MPLPPFQNMHCAAGTLRFGCIGCTESHGSPLEATMCQRKARARPRSMLARFLVFTIIAKLPGQASAIEAERPGQGSFACRLRRGASFCRKPVASRSLPTVRMRALQTHSLKRSSTRASVMAAHSSSRVPRTATRGPCAAVTRTEGDGLLAMDCGTRRHALDHTPTD